MSCSTEKFEQLVEKIPLEIPLFYPTKKRMTLYLKSLVPEVLEKRSNSDKARLKISKIAPDTPGPISRKSKLKLSVFWDPLLIDYANLEQSDLIKYELNIYKIENPPEDGPIIIDPKAYLPSDSLFGINSYEINIDQLKSGKFESDLKFETPVQNTGWQSVVIFIAIDRYRYFTDRQGFTPEMSHP